MLSATLNNISAMSWKAVLLMEKTGVPGKYHRPVASYMINIRLFEAHGPILYSVFS